MTRQAVRTTPDDNINLARRLHNFANSLRIRYERTERFDDLEEAIQATHWSCTVISTPPIGRIKVSGLPLRLLLKRKDHDGACALCIEAIDLLKLVHNRSLTLQDQQYVVSHFSGLATQSCSLTFQMGQPLFKALHLLETGRSVTLAILMNHRSDTSKVRAANPTLCALYESPFAWR